MTKAQPTLKDVNEFYAIVFLFTLQFQIWNEAMFETFTFMLESIGEAYCEENNLPFPLSKEQRPEGLLSKMTLGEKSTLAFGDLQQWINDRSGFIFSI
jgi:hypothetical protein